MLSEAQVCTVVVDESQFTFNGGTLPEISVESGNFLELGDGRSNIVQDSAGILLWTSEPTDVNLEYGNNQFLFEDSTNAGACVAIGDSANALTYITGNYFGPIGVTDPLFTNHLTPHSETAWVYSYLRLQNQTEQTIDEPTSTVNISAKAFVESYLGAVSTDTLQEVTLKWKLFPDSSTWTTTRLVSSSPDSIYQWELPVGNFSTLISFVFWARDAHGRFITSPLSADTTDPDSGVTHFTFITPGDTTLINGDTLTVWAPAVLHHSIYLNGGVLIMKPWPGASDHTIQLAENVTISIGGANYRGKWQIQGTESMPITLEPIESDTSWLGWNVWNGSLTAAYCTFRSPGYVDGWNSSPVICMEHCIFDSVIGWTMFEGLSRDSSYFRNCVFSGALNEGESGGVLFASGDVEISDCWIHNNKGPGLWLYDAYDTEISGTVMSSNEGPGLCTEGEVSSVNFSCCQFWCNGGDSIAEVFTDAGSFDFAGGSNCIFGDYGGPLLEGPAMSSFDIADGTNGFYLLDSTGTYILTGDETDTMNISNNYWYPFNPDTEIFWDHFDPDSILFWINDSTAEEVGSCEESSQQSLPIKINSFSTEQSGDRQIPTESLPSPQAQQARRIWGTSAANSNKVLSAAEKRAAVQPAVDALYKEAIQLQRNMDYATAAQKYGNFIAGCNRRDPRLATALSRYFITSRKSGVRTGLADFFAVQERQASTSYARKTAHGLRLESLVLEGKPEEALGEYEEIIAKPVSLRDSVQAVIGAMRIHFRCGKDKKLPCRYSENRISNMQELVTRMAKLSRLLYVHRQATAVVSAPVTVPSQYHLYQNYPNPFNPNTEIKFDLPEAVKVQIKIFNILGQEVITLMDEVRPAGAYRITWDSRSSSGVQVASGVYVYQIRAEKFMDSKKMVLIR
jgi:hypothetical protein